MQQTEKWRTPDFSDAICSNNRPLDVFGLYKAVVECGGLLANEKYDENGRWIGTINFAGIIFPKLHNYTKDNRATSVGNQLLSNYRKFLYDYERAWRHIDILGAGLNPGETADNELQPVVKAQPNAMTLKPEQLEDGKGTCEDAAGIGGSGSGAASGVSLGSVMPLVFVQPTPSCSIPAWSQHLRSPSWNTLSAAFLLMYSE